MPALPSPPPSRLKVMSGFSDEFYREATAFYSCPEHQSAGKKAYYTAAPGMTPSVWFEPLEVWEIRGADMTLSPVHLAAHGRIPLHPNNGVSLRFPR